MAPSQFVSHCTIDALKSAANLLKTGGLVAFPTETVYGLGADAENESAVARIYEVKGRPANHPLIVHIGDWQLMGDWVSEVPDYAIDLARSFWPGPMTLVMKRSELAKDFITGGQDTVGIRVPDRPVALQLLTDFSKVGGKGIAAPSANRFGQVSPTTAQAVREEIGDFLNESDQIIDEGPCAVGIESTIIDCSGDHPKILRPGAITEEMITAATGLSVGQSDNSIRVSGSLEAHYAPIAKVILDGAAGYGDGFIALAEIPTPPGAIRLASPKNNEAYAKDLYSALRSGDAQGVEKIIAITPKGHGIAIAIRDRLQRAAVGSAGGI
mgnify:CR=1 FL=1